MGLSQSNLEIIVHCSALNNSVHSEIICNVLSTALYTAAIHNFLWWGFWPPSNCFGFY